MEYNFQSIPALICHNIAVGLHVVYRNHSDMCLCSAGILEVMFRMLDAYRNKQYITPRVLQLVLSYLAQS